MINQAQKLEIIKKFGKDEHDTGSAAVQTAILTARINDLMPHFKANKHDNHSRRGLLRMVARRRKHLKYIKNNNVSEYKELIKSLGLRK